MAPFCLDDPLALSRCRHVAGLLLFAWRAVGAEAVGRLPIGVDHIDRTPLTALEAVLAGLKAFFMLCPRSFRRAYLRGPGTRAHLAVRPHAITLRPIHVVVRPNGPPLLALEAELAGLQSALIIVSLPSRHDWHLPHFIRFADQVAMASVLCQQGTPESPESATLSCVRSVLG